MLLGVLGLSGALGVSLACDEGASASPPPPAPPHAADFRSAGVDAALDAAGQVLRTRGFARDGEAWRGFVVGQSAQVSDVAMSAGTCHVVVAAGSSALRELDVHVFDADGSNLAQDASTGGRAVVRFCPSQSGTYYVAVRATAGSGLFGAVRYTGPTGLDIRLDDVFPAAAAPEPARAPSP